MALQNTTQGYFNGKMGTSVGFKWKDKRVERAYSIPSNPRTDKQVAVRTKFSDMTKFIALFSDNLKYLTALDVSSMSVRNAIIKLNKDVFSGDAFIPSELQVSNGGLQRPNLGTPEKSAENGQITVTWTAPTATNISSSAQLVFIAVDSVNSIADVVTAPISALTITTNASFTESTTVNTYAYILDYRNTAKVASKSVSNEITA